MVMFEARKDGWNQTEAFMLFDESGNEIPLKALRHGPWEHDEYDDVRDTFYGAKVEEGRKYFFLEAHHGIAELLQVSATNDKSQKITLANNALFVPTDQLKELEKIGVPEVIIKKYCSYVD